MRICNMGYEVEEDLIPPERCHSDGRPDSCKECRNYNREYDLIEQAIESAKCRIYRLKANPGSTEAHQKKAENQQELMEITIRALEFYRDEYE
ncbi:MAG: hypothetical protein KHZ96_07240 [Coprobacillus sp.]|nr:hypothetical protein [Coprobacillus sp.]